MNTEPQKKNDLSERDICTKFITPASDKGPSYPLWDRLVNLFCELHTIGGSGAMWKFPGLK